MRRADRLIKTVHFLRAQRRAVTAKRIAEEFQICSRTVYRDIRDLIYSGAPISGEAGVGYIINKQYYLPPITFDAAELEIIRLGISMVDQSTNRDFTEKANSALEKIYAALPTNLQGQLQQSTTFSRPNTDMPSWIVNFLDLQDCIRTRHKIHVTYRDLSERHSSRTLRPLALVLFNPVWLLVSWCEKRHDFRNFRLDRIETLDISADVFADEPDKNLAAFKAKETCL